MATFHYGVNADSWIDVAYGINGGAWSLSGSVHMGNNRGSWVGPTSGSYYARYLLSQFQYGLYKQYADCAEGQHLYQGHDIVESLTWVGSGQQSSYSISYYDNQRHTNYYYNDFGPGYGWGRSSYSLAHVSGAVSVWGASLGTQSGASQYVTYSYSFGQAAHHYLYGLHAYPYAADVIYASDN